MSAKLIAALEQNQAEFGVRFDKDQLDTLALYSDLVKRHNPVLHLTGPCSEEEFAIRHILESVFALGLLKQCRKFADIGSGAGLPGIPCLVADKRLTGFLVESKPKKAKFLVQAVRLLGLDGRARIVGRPFEEISNPGVDHVFCRAIDKFADRVRGLVKWSGTAVPVFFAGPSVRNELDRNGYAYSATLIPKTERRFVFVLEPLQAKRGG